MDKDTKRVAAEARRQGWKIETGSKNYKFIPPDPAMSAVYVAKTPGASNSLKKVISQMKRRGFIWPPTRKREYPHESARGGKEESSGIQVTGVDDTDRTLYVDERRSVPDERGDDVNLGMDSGN